MESKDEISVLLVLNLLVFLFQLMFSLLVILFVNYSNIFATGLVESGRTFFNDEYY